ncbi:MAG: cation-transporting P-type ATPase [Methanothrix sp.]|nr:cation-transporting P-type ATPase [Methanothrix sp.]MCX8207468.1 cation-transporting P-type ATPase [Methanothrix sp.]
MMEELGTGPDGLTEDEAAEKLRKYGSNIPRQMRKPRDLILLFSQFRRGWFIESVISASMVVLVIRTRRSLSYLCPADTSSHQPWQWERPHFCCPTRRWEGFHVHAASHEFSGCNRRDCGRICYCGRDGEESVLQKIENICTTQRLEAMNLG